MNSCDDAVDPELRQARLSRFGRVLAFITLAFVTLVIFTSLTQAAASLAEAQRHPLAPPHGNAHLSQLLSATTLDLSG